MREYVRIILTIFISLCFCACSKEKYMPVKNTKIDSTYVSKIKIDDIRSKDSIYTSKISIDSAYNKDSVYVEHKGDTVYFNRYKYSYRYIEKHDTVLRERIDTVLRERIDTILHERTDTIQVFYPVETKLTIWQKIKLGLSSSIYLITFGIIAICVVYIIKRKQL